MFFLVLSLSSLLLFLLLQKYVEFSRLSELFFSFLFYFENFPLVRYRSGDHLGSHSTVTCLKPRPATTSNMDYMVSPKAVLLQPKLLNSNLEGNIFSWENVFLLLCLFHLFSIFLCDIFRLLFSTLWHQIKYFFISLNRFLAVMPLVCMSNGICTHLQLTSDRFFAFFISLFSVVSFFVLFILSLHFFSA